MQKKIVKKWCFTPNEIVQAIRRAYLEIPLDAECDLLQGGEEDDEVFLEFERIEDDDAIEWRP